MSLTVGASDGLRAALVVPVAAVALGALVTALGLRRSRA